MATKKEIIEIFKKMNINENDIHFKNNEVNLRLLEDIEAIPIKDFNIDRAKYLKDSYFNEVLNEKNRNELSNVKYDAQYYRNIAANN
jgi:hypothetical protein